MPTDLPPQRSVAEAEAIATQMIQMLEDLYRRGGPEGREIVWAYEAAFEHLEEDPSSERRQAEFLRSLLSLQIETLEYAIGTLKKVRRDTANKVRVLGNATETATTARAFVDALGAAIRAAEGGLEFCRTGDEGKAKEAIDALNEAFALLKNHAPPETFAP